MIPDVAKNFFSTTIPNGARSLASTVSQWRISQFAQPKIEWIGNHGGSRLFRGAANHWKGIGITLVVGSALYTGRNKIANAYRAASTWVQEKLKKED